MLPLAIEALVSIGPNFREFVGITAGVVACAETPRYLYSILTRKTVPSSITWISMAVFSVSFLVTYHRGGAEDTIWVPLGDAFGYVVIAITSAVVRRHVIRLSLLDLTSVALAMIALVLFHISSEMVFLSLATFCALAPTIIKTWMVPAHEDAVAWAMTVTANSLNLLAITKLVEMAYVGTVFGLDLLIFILALRRYRRLPIQRTG